MNDMDDERISLKFILGMTLVVLSATVVGSLIKAGGGEQSMVFVLILLGGGAGLWALDGWWQHKQNKRKHRTKTVHEEEEV